MVADESAGRPSAAGSRSRGEEGVGGQSILWRRLDQPGHEFGRLVGRDSSWQLSGTAVFAHTRQPCRLEYLVVCDAAWRTVSGRVAGWIGDETVEIEVSVDSARQWRLNGRACPAVAGRGHPRPGVNPSPPFLSIPPLRLALRPG